MFAELGVPIIDTDKIARTVVEPGAPALERVRNEFPSHVIDSSGRLDRTAMRRLVFSDENMRRRLENILHPLIQQETLRQAGIAQGAYQIIVVPLLVNSPLRRFVDRILVVDCDEATQIDRLIARDVESRDQARQILAAQASREERLAIADDVVSNGSDLDHTRQQVAILHETYLQLSQNGYYSGAE